jgi:hypothetical protein
MKRLLNAVLVSNSGAILDLTVFNIAAEGEVGQIILVNAIVLDEEHQRATRRDRINLLICSPYTANIL